MHLRCPHCQNPIELADLPSGGEITCAGCGSSFQLDKFATATFTPPANKRLGKFEVLSTVGHGAFGTVFKARDTELDRTVAIKVPRAGNVGPTPEDVDRFLREARSVAQLRFPSIISIHEVGADNGTPYLVCDFVEGVTLADYLSGRGFSFKESAKLLAEVADALQYAHSLGVVHRDVKPSNIMIRPGGSPCVMDFGLAKRDAGEITMTIDGQILGTPAYMSPEQARGESHRVDGRSDVYSLGVILYQLLTNELPFRGNKAMLLHQVLHEEPQWPRALNDKIPRDLETIALKAMAKEPGRRYGSAREMAEDLRRWLAGEPILARPVGAAERLWRWCKRKPALAGLVFTASILIASFIAAGFWYARDQADRERERILRQANATQKRLIIEQAIRKSLDEAKSSKMELHTILARPGGVFELLNRPENWHARIGIANAALDHSKILEAGAGNLDPALRDEIRELEIVLRADDADRSLAIRLEDIRTSRATSINGKFNYAKALDEYPTAIARAGLPSLGDDTLIHEIKRSPIKEELVSALDDWAISAFRSGNVQLADKLLAVARRAMPDTVWGDKLRHSALWQKPKTLADLAKTATPGGLPPQLLVLVGELLPGENAVRESWLRRAQRNYPSDFVVNYTLANALADRVEATGFYRVALTLRPRNAPAFFKLGEALFDKFDKRKAADAEFALTKAVEIDPAYAPAHHLLGNVLRTQGKLTEAVSSYERAAAADATWAVAHTEISTTLRMQHKIPEAIAAAKRAIETHPKRAGGYRLLGLALREQKKYAEAMAAFQAGLKLDPIDEGIHYEMGKTLFEQSKFTGACESFQRSVNLLPLESGVRKYREEWLRKSRDMWALEKRSPGLAILMNLGNDLFQQKKYSEAVAAFQNAVEVDPKHGLAYKGLAKSLGELKKIPEAIEAYEKAISADPNDLPAYARFVDYCRDEKKLAVATKYFSEAVKSNPKNVRNYWGLGVALRYQKKNKEAVTIFQKAIQVDPKFPRAHGGLALTFFEEGSFAEAETSLQKTVEMLPSDDGMRGYYIGWLKRTQEKLALEKRLSLVLNEGSRANHDDLFEMAKLCGDYKSRHVTASKLYQLAFKIKPASVDELTNWHRYNAACDAALANAGRGEEASSLAPIEKYAHRKLALAWLQADIDIYVKLIRNNPALVEQRLAHWQQDEDLESVRNPSELKKLPEPERQEWGKLWAQVGALQQNAMSRVVPEKK